ncbi:hypothetical protein DFJ73DRAFT_773494 [Zopfochytrium polystomum]|nr:hypothetical protein DFJ73DRAFT_773494 [Zopfochytrium polystomum]
MHTDAISNNLSQDADAQAAAPGSSDGKTSSTARHCHAVKDSVYVLPCDDSSNGHHTKHNLIRAAFDGIFHSPQRELFERGGGNVHVLDMAYWPASGSSSGASP